MNSLIVGFVAFIFIFGGALSGMFLRGAMPQSHLADDSKDSVKLGMGLVATMCALVLGLLIASAKTYYDTQNAELTEMSAKVVLLDRMLSHYGPETNDCRAFLRSVVERSIEQLWRRGGAPGSHLDPAAVSSEALSEKTLGLAPKDDRQHFIQSQAVTLELSLAQMRWLMFEQSSTQVPKPLVVVLVFWLTIIFIGWGIFAPRNATVVATWFVSALSVSGAIFLILEMYTPYSGLILVSSDPLRAALAHLGQ
jgi:hypothetical protein